MISVQELFAPENFDLFMQVMEGPDVLIKQAKETKIPGLANRVNEIYQDSGIGAPNWIRAIEEIKQAETSPAEYAKTRLNMLSRDYTYSSLQGFGDTYGKIYADSSAKNLQEIKDLSSYLISNNYMSPNDVASVTSEGTNFATQDMASQYASSKGGSFSDALGLIAPVLLSVVAPGLGSAIGSSLGATGATAAGIGNAVVSGALAEASGGDFVKGALGSAVGSIGQGVVAPSISNALGGGSFGNVAAGVLTGGAASELLGGDFATGALRGGINSGINDYQQQLNQEKFDNSMQESGLAGQTSVGNIQYPQVSELPANLSQGVTDILNYAASSPAVQLAAAPNYVGELSGVQYDPDYVSDSGTGAYRLDISGTGETTGPSQTTTSAPEQDQINIDDLITQINPDFFQNLTAEEIQAIIGNYNFATSQDIQDAVNSIEVPQGLSEADVQKIVSNAFANNPGITAIDVQGIVQGALNNLPEGLSSDDVKNIVANAVSNIPAAPTEQDILDIISGQKLATGQDLVNLSNQLGITQQELVDELSKVQESFGSQVNDLQGQFANSESSSAQRFLDIMKSVGFLGNGLKFLTSTLKSSQEASLPQQFDIVAPPSDWNSPTYNQAFKPSAQLDFGSPALLSGTQWGKPQTFDAPKAYNISDVINTLNYDSVPFVQPQYQMPQQISPTDFASRFQSPTVGTNDIIGNLGGKPVSISDIVAGIQSQYG